MLAQAGKYFGGTFSARFVFCTSSVGFVWHWHKHESVLGHFFGRTYFFCTSSVWLCAHSHKQERHLGVLGGGLLQYLEGGVLPSSSGRSTVAGVLPSSSTTSSSISSSSRRSSNSRW